MSKDKGLYIQSQGEYTRKAVSDDHYFKFFILRSAVITIQKVRGTVSDFVQCNGDVVITLYCIVKNDCLAFKTTIFCIS